LSLLENKLPFKRLVFLRDMGLFILGCGLVLNMFFQTSFSVMADMLMSDFSVTAAQLASLGSIFFYVYSVMQVPSGVLADVFGPRQVVSSGLLVAGIGALFFACCHHMVTAYLGRALVGLGISLLYISTLRYVANWWPANQYSTVIGIVTAVGNLGSILATMPLARLVDFIGWRGTYFLLAGLALLLAVGCFLLVRNKPQEWCNPLQTERKYFSYSQRLDIHSFITSFKSILHIRALRPMLIIVTGLRGSQMAFIGAWGVSYLMQVYGLKRTEAASFMLLTSLGRIVGFPLLGAIADRIGDARYPYILGNLTYLALWFCFIIFFRIQPPQIFLIILYFLLGVLGATSVLSFVLVKQYTPLQSTGIALGLVNGIGIFGTTLFQLAIGFVLDQYWDGIMIDGVRIYSTTAYQAAFRVFFIMLVCTTLPVLFIKDEGVKVKEHLLKRNLPHEKSGSSTTHF
jgi:sugar phosphate permease